MKLILFVIALLGAYLAVDLFAGVVAPWFGPLVLWATLIGLVWALIKIGRA